MSKHYKIKAVQLKRDTAVLGAMFDEEEKHKMAMVEGDNSGNSENMSSKQHDAEMSPVKQHEHQIDSKHFLKSQAFASN